MDTRQFAQVPMTPLSIVEYEPLIVEYAEKSPLTRKLEKLLAITAITTTKMILIGSSYMLAQVIMRTGIEVNSNFSFIISTLFMILVALTLYKKPKNVSGDSIENDGNNGYSANSQTRRKIVLPIIQVLCYNGLLATLVFGANAIVSRWI